MSGRPIKITCRDLVEAESRHALQIARALVLFFAADRPGRFELWQDPFADAIWFMWNDAPDFSPAPSWLASIECPTTIH
jgi:hypothetical protein